MCDQATMAASAAERKLMAELDAMKALVEQLKSQNTAQGKSQNEKSKSIFSIIDFIYLITFFFKLLFLQHPSDS